MKNNLWPDWEENPWIFKPSRELTLEEINMLLTLFFGNKVFSNQAYNEIPENLKEHFVNRLEGEK